MSDTERSTDTLAQRMLSRTRQLASSGLEWHYAGGLAWLEERIRQWPAAWGDHLQVLVYGDFQAPEDDLSFPALGITVHHEKQENTVVRGALCVLKATVTVAEKSVPAVIDAARRLNVLLGAYTLVEWGNSVCGWWSWVTHDSGGCALTKIDHVDIPKAIADIESRSV